MDQNDAAIIFQKNWRKYSTRKKYLIDKQYEDTMFALCYLEQMKQSYKVDLETIHSLKQYNKDLEKFMKIIRQKYDLNQQEVFTYDLPHFNEPEE